MMIKRNVIPSLVAVAFVTGCAMPDGENLTLFSALRNQSDLKGPSSLPPLGYSGEYWVDTKGCIFIRTGGPENQRWVPQVDNSRKPICDPSKADPGFDRSEVRVAGAGPDITPRVEIDPLTGLRTEVLAPVAIRPTFIKIGDFGDRDAGLLARSQFLELGFPVVGSTVIPPKGRAVSVVLGPFSVRSALDDGIAQAQALGYADAFSFTN